MSNKRFKIFIIIIASLLAICLVRLVQMQLQPGSGIQEKIAELKLQQGLSRQLKTTRGRILDRKGRVLAADKPRFYISIDYELARFGDRRFHKVELLRAAKKDDADAAISTVQKQFQDRLEDLQQLIEKCTQFGPTKGDIEGKIRQINDSVWQLRRHLAWKRSYPDIDFEAAVPDANERLLLTGRVDIAEMHRSWPLVELKGDDDIFTAQLEFSDTEGVQILPRAHRFYPYDSTAAQTIGWVGRATQQADRQFFADDKLWRYLDDELCGREDGVEYVCEGLLRGRRGEVVYDIDHKLVSRTETRPGRDVRLSLDVELQKRIEDYLTDCELNKNCGAPTAAVVIDVVSAEILALVSLPRFDLNGIRDNYASVAKEPNQPLLNRAINKDYPPGSVVKPLILIAGLESGKITPGEVISCPANNAPAGWPSCWIYNRFGIGHDGSWLGNARSAIKGSCNIYFSRLADRIEPVVLQRWLYDFGYGREVTLTASPGAEGLEKRDFRQAQGTVSSSVPRGSVLRFADLPRLKASERRYFGIGQGNLRTTPLQVANAMAAIARGGVYRPPRLFADEPDWPDVGGVNLDISPQTMDIVRGGMAGVVSEPGGTAYNAFAYSGFGREGVRVYGKTGSTEAPDTAWFGGFAEDGGGRKIALAVVVEGGQHGSSDAAPLARDIISFCIEAGYLANKEF